MEAFEEFHVDLIVHRAVKIEGELEVERKRKEDWGESKEAVKSCEA